MSSDLFITSINPQALTLDGQTLTVSGSLSANIANKGSKPVSAFDITFSFSRFILGDKFLLETLKLNTSAKEMEYDGRPQTSQPTSPI